MNISNQTLPLPQLAAEAAPPRGPAGGSETGLDSFQALLQKRRESGPKESSGGSEREPGLREEAYGGTGEERETAPDPIQAGWAALLVIQPPPASVQDIPPEHMGMPAATVQTAAATPVVQPVPAEGASIQPPGPEQPLAAPSPAVQVRPAETLQTQAPTRLESEPDSAAQASPPVDGPAGRTWQEREQVADNRQYGGNAESQGGRKDWKVVDARQEIGARPLFQNVEHTPVKVGEPRVVDLAASDPEPQLAQQVGQALERGEQTLTLELSPRYLGKVTVELTRTGDGTLQVLLRPETVKAAELLAEHSSGLGNLLQSGTHVPVQVEVQRYQEGQQAQQQYAQDQQSGGQEGRSGGQSQEHRQQQDQSQRFLQQLRLGLVSLSPEET